jgi:hypothetical protein
MKENYPIFIKWSKILDWLMDKVETFPKSVRFTISTRIVNLSLDIMEMIVESIYSQSHKRISIINQTNLKLEQLRVFIRITMERRYLSSRQFEYIAEEINEAGKMLGGWKKHEKG